MKVPLAVTVAGKHPARYLDVALARAAAWGLPVIDRPEKGSITAMLERAEALLVLGGDGWHLTDPTGALGFTPGMARVRIKRLAAGDVQQPDMVVRLCELKPGDAVLDGTLGLAADALVCEHVVGPTGRVIGVEASRPLFLLVSEGLKAAGSAIEVRSGAVLEVLQGMADGAVDCVILDPMFEARKASSPAFDMLRRYAVHEPLTKETLEEAQRVARRWVVVKGGRYGQEFKRLGLVAVPMTRETPLIWARLPGRAAR